MLPPRGRHGALAFLEPGSSYRVWEIQNFYQAARASHSGPARENVLKNEAQKIEFRRYVKPPNARGSPDAESPALRGREPSAHSERERFAGRSRSGSASLPGRAAHDVRNGSRSATRPRPQRNASLPGRAALPSPLSPSLPQRFASQAPRLRAGQRRRAERKHERGTEAVPLRGESRSAVSIHS